VAEQLWKLGSEEFAMEVRSEILGCMAGPTKRDISGEWFINIWRFNQ